MTFLWWMNQIVIPAVMAFVLLGSLGGVVLGVGLLWRTAPTLAWIGRMNRWVSTRRALRPLEAQRQVRPHSRAAKLALGAFLVAGGAFALYVMLVRMQMPQLASVAGVDLKRWFAAALVLQAMRWLVVAGSLLAIAVGVALVAFPDAFRRLDAAMNRWYSTRNLVPPSSYAMNLSVERMVERHPRAAGWVIAVSCLLVGLSMALLFTARR